MPSIGEVGNSLTSVRIDQMIVNLARGLALGQYELDKTGINITKLMALPESISIGDETYSMLEAGFLPTFYDFVETILEIKMEINIREESESSRSTSETASASVEATASGSWGWGSASATASAAYSRTTDATYSQKYSQDLSAQSLMRTKILPRPAPQALVDKITSYLENYDEDADAGDKEEWVQEFLHGITT